MPEPICKATRDELEKMRETDARIVQILHDLTARIAALERAAAVNGCGERMRGTGMRNTVALRPLMLSEFTTRKDVELTPWIQGHIAVWQREGLVSVTAITKTTAWVELTPKGRAEIERKGGV